MLGRRGKISLAILLVGGWLAIWIWSSTYPPHTQNQTASYHHQPNTAVDDNSSFFLAIGTWAESKHDAIEALTAIGVLAFTIALVAATIFLVRATSRLAVATAGLRDAEREQAEELQKSTEMAEKQFLITARQTDIAEKQHAIGRMQFLTNHRPILRVRYFRLVNTSDDQIIIQFTIANVGGNEAKLIGSSARAQFFITGRQPAPFYISGKEVIDAPRRFLAGATDEGRILFNKQSPDAVIEMWRKGQTLHAYGYIVYEDTLENTRTTAFGRRWNADRERFDIVDDPDYEYED